MNDLFYLSEDQRMIRDLARKIARERIAPRAAHYDETETYPEEPIRALMDAGLYGLWLPEEHGRTDPRPLAPPPHPGGRAWGRPGAGPRDPRRPPGRLSVPLAGPP